MLKFYSSRINTNIKNITRYFNKKKKKKMIETMTFRSTRKLYRVNIEKIIF